MSRFAGPTLVASETGAKIPDWLRLAIAAVSGAALSLSFTGLYLGIYSWICVAALLLAVLGASGRVAFACGFFHALLFVISSVPWIATVLSVHGGLPIAGGWGVLLLISAAWGVLAGGFTLTVDRISCRSIELACMAAPFVWVTFEFVRAHLPEISFPWNLLGYPASANLGLLQIAAFTGIYGLSFLAAGFNALLAWAVASKRMELKQRVGIAGMATAVLAVATLVGPRLVPQARAQHFARAVQLNFPEVPEYPSDWFAKNVQQLDEVSKMSLAPSAEQPDLLVWPEAPAPFSFEDSQFAKLASSLALHFRSEEHTSELQSRLHLVCRLLLEKKKHNTATEFALDAQRLALPGFSSLSRSSDSDSPIAASACVLPLACTRPAHQASTLVSLRNA